MSEGNCPERNLMAGISWWGNCLGGSCPGELFKANGPVGETPRIIIFGGNFMGVIVWGDRVIGGIIQG